MLAEPSEPPPKADMESKLRAGKLPTKEKKTFNLITISNENYIN